MIFQGEIIEFISLRPSLTIIMVIDCWQKWTFSAFIVTFLKQHKKT